MGFFDGQLEQASIEETMIKQNLAKAALEVVGHPLSGAVDMFRALMPRREKVLHLSAHGRNFTRGSREEFVLIYKDNPVQASTLATIISLWCACESGSQESIECVVVNACHSRDLAWRLINKGVPTVVSWASPVTDLVQSGTTSHILAPACNVSHLNTHLST